MGVAHHVQVQPQSALLLTLLCGQLFVGPGCLTGARRASSGHAMNADSPLMLATRAHGPDRLIGGTAAPTPE